MAYIVDKEYCMSSFLAVRYVVDDNRIFKEGVTHKPLDMVSEDEKCACGNAEEIDLAIREIYQKRLCC